MFWLMWTPREILPELAESIFSKYLVCQAGLASAAGPLVLASGHNGNSVASYQRHCKHINTPSLVKHLIYASQFT